MDWALVVSTMGGPNESRGCGEASISLAPGLLPALVYGFIPTCPESKS